MSSDIIWKTERRKLKDLVFTEYNPRKLSNKQHQELKDSLDKFNLAEIPVINADNKILAGHMRIKILKEKLGEDFEIEIRVPDRKLNKKDADEYLIRSNKNTGEWDFEKISDEFDFDNLVDWGFDETEITGLFNEENIENFAKTHGDDDFEAIEKKAETKKGDLYELGCHKLLCGDAVNNDDIKKLMNKETAELLFTSPPYSNMRDYNKNKNLEINHIAQFLICFKPYSKYIAVNLGLQRKDNEIYSYWDKYIKTAKKAKLKLLSWNIWNKTDPQSIGHMSAMFPIEHEWIFVFGETPKKLNATVENKSAGDICDHSWVRQRDGSTKKKKPYKIKKYRAMGTVNTINAEKRRDGFDHPARFSVKLPESYILSMTNKNDIVVDCFGGAGTTLIACEKTERQCRTIELDEQYCDLIVNRYIDFCRRNNKEIKVLKNGEDISNNFDNS